MLDPVASRKAFEAAHASDDTDFEPVSKHHTLGKGPNQASPGNHTHSINIGGVKVYLATVPPVGHLKLDGAVINKVDYPEFFEAVGITAATLTLPTLAGLVTRVL